MTDDSRLLPPPDPAVLHAPHRLQRLHSLDLLNGSMQPAFDRLTRLAAHLFNVPVAIISLVEDNCQRFASQIGLPDRFRSMTPLTHSFCQYVVSGSSLLSVDDARNDPVLKHNHAIPDLGVIAYLGCPLVTRDGLTLGALAVIDTQPRQWTDAERDLLTDLTASVITEITLRDRLLRSEQAEAQMSRAMERMQILRRIDHELAEALDLDSVLTLVMDAALRVSRADDAAIVLLREDALEVISGAGHYVTGDRLELNEGIMGRVIRTRTPELVSDVSTDPDYRVYVPTTRAQMTIPLQHRDRLIGLLALETERPARFTSEALEFLTLIGARIAIAIDTAQMVALLNQQYADLQRLYDRVKELEQTKTDMIRIAAHDLRNPLGTVIGYAELLEEISDNLSDAQLDFIHYIQRGGEKMKKIITDILSLERFEANPLLMQREITDLGLLIKLTQAEYAAAAVGKGLTMTLDLPTEPVLLPLDTGQIREALDNLISNAVKYTPPGGTVTITLTRTADHVRFTVTDTGDGIPLDQQGRLFQPFFRAQTDATRQVEGTGLGLHLVKNIIMRHGGAVLFTSAPGQGSTFGFTLPLEAAPAA